MTGTCAAHGQHVGNTWETRVRRWTGTMIRSSGTMITLCAFPNRRVARVVAFLVARRVGRRDGELGPDDAALRAGGLLPARVRWFGRQDDGQVEGRDRCGFGRSFGGFVVGIRPMFGDLAPTITTNLGRFGPESPRS